MLILATILETSGILYYKGLVFNMDFCNIVNALRKRTVLTLFFRVKVFKIKY